MLIGVDGFRSIGRPGATVTRRFPDLAFTLLFIMALSTNKSITCSCSSVDIGDYEGVDFPATRRANETTPAVAVADDASGGGSSPANVVRRIRLYNRCSGGYLQFYFNPDAQKNVVDARGKPRSPLAILRVETDSYGSRIRIKFDKFDKYLCFNRRKRITTKWNGRDRKCVFVERISDNHYTELESAWEPGVYLGFNREGRFLDYSRYVQRRTCFQYIKSEDDNHLSRFQQPNYGPSVNISETNHHHLQHRHRHSKRLNNNKNLNRHSQGVR